LHFGTTSRSRVRWVSGGRIAALLRRVWLLIWYEAVVIDGDALSAAAAKDEGCGYCQERKNNARNGNSDTSTVGEGIPALILAKSVIVAVSGC